MRAGLRQVLRRAGPLPALTRRGQIFDVAIVLALGLAAALAGQQDDERQATFHHQVSDWPMQPAVPVPDPFLPIHEEQPGWPLVILLVLVPLVVRRRYPLAVLWVVLATAPLVSDFDAALRLSFYACVVAAYSAAVYSPYRFPALASLPLAAFLYTQLREEAVPTVPDDAVPFLILIPIAVVAGGLRRWKRHADEQRARLSTLEREQAEALRRAAEHERARIARELHDVVTHNVSVMVIQAGAARKVLGSEPERSREALLAVEAGGRAALAELRHVMGLLTMDSDGPDPAGAADLVPQPGLDRLDALVQRVRDTGVPVELTVTGTPRPLPSGVELAAYRVVQEALTNTVKHAAGAAATVLVEYRADRLQVEVTDTGGTTAATTTTGNRRGLIGLRERLAVYGGTLHTRPRISGGFRLTAQIPLETS